MTTTTSFLVGDKVLPLYEDITPEQTGPYIVEVVLEDGHFMIEGSNEIFHSSAFFYIEDAVMSDFC